jgi:hypothetical protein
MVGGESGGNDTGAGIGRTLSQPSQDAIEDFIIDIVQTHLFQRCTAPYSYAVFATMHTER